MCLPLHLPVMPALPVYLPCLPTCVFHSRDYLFSIPVPKLWWCIFSILRDRGWYRCIYRYMCKCVLLFCSVATRGRGRCNSFGCLLLPPRAALGAINPGYHNLLKELLVDPAIDVQAMASLSTPRLLHFYGLASSLFAFESCPSCMFVSLAPPLLV